MKYSETKKPPTNRELIAKQTEKIIYETALLLFRKYGYDKVTVESITQKAGFSKGTFYTYFESKDAVLTKTFEEIDSYYETIYRKVPKGTLPSEQVLIFADAICRYCSESFGLNYIKVVYMNQIGLGKRPSILGNKSRSIYKLLKIIVKAGQKSGEFTDEISENEMVDILARSLHGLLYDWCLYDGRFDLVETGRMYFENILKMLKKSFV